LNKQLHDLNTKFLELSVKQANNENSSLSEEMTGIRKQISSLGVYARLYGDFNGLVGQLGQCKELMEDSDKEVRKMAEEDIQGVQEMMEDL
jgi:peptide chain release factor 1